MFLLPWSVTQDQTDTSLAEPAASAAAQPCDSDRRAAERAEWQLALLRGIAEDGAAMLHIIRKQAEQASWVGAGGDVMYERIARSVRQTVAFANKIEDEAKLTPEQRAAARARRVAAEERALLDKPDPALAPHRDAAGHGAEASDPIGLADPAPRTDREYLLSGLRERFGDPSVDDELNGRTYGEILRTILTDVGASTDLSIFTQEELARVYAPGRQRRPNAAPVSLEAAPAEPAAIDEVPQEEPPRIANEHDPP
jgi:hypothetical protein